MAVEPVYVCEKARPEYVMPKSMFGVYCPWCGYKLALHETTSTDDPKEG